MTEKTKKWSDEKVSELQSIIGSETPVSASTVAKAAALLEVSERSIASKLRSLDIAVASLAKEKEPAFSSEETDALSKYLNKVAGTKTYKEIAAEFADSKFNAKQIQGKVLALELTSLVKPSPQIEVARKYSEAEEAKFVQLANNGATLEALAEAMGRSLESVRGKALSLTRKGAISSIPTQTTSHAKVKVDPVEALGTDIVNMTVAEIAKATDKTDRGIRTLLTRRSLTVADYDGKAKKNKADAKKEKANAE